MSASNRAAILTKVHKVLKKYYQPVAPPSDRGLLEHLLYACCLENSAHEAGLWRMADAPTSKPMRSTVAEDQM